ncbi:hypothetical protein PILCRDRAFT_15808 [Piloderma croceum F 1598]|uniref:Antifreeze protein n=1 Tax=Piloderma croceum (strain F 1598) TaxID=765440 RepID=A0A0C3AG39_PILCF|nr:hypothetical protein PILCRDRAFT_15808 [Piloderma croceum F 1598]
MSSTIAVIALGLLAISHSTYAAGPPAVNLRSAANYTILAASGVSTVPPSAITGNVGLSPAASTFLTGFSTVLDSSGTFSKSTQVTGKLFAASYTSPTPSMLTTAISDMQTAYTDASGRILPNFLNLGTGKSVVTLSPLGPGLYKWTTGVTVSSAPTFSGGSSDSAFFTSLYLLRQLTYDLYQAWILQIAGTLTMASAKTMLLAGGANATNIIWAVAGGVTLGTTSHFEGVILGKTGITLQTGMSMNGRALAQTLVALQKANVVAPS